MRVRAIVIGSGHNGLVAALRLAERGHSVLVLETAAVPGGGVRSEEATLPGFVHDTCAGFFPLTAVSPAFQELALDLDWVNPEVAMAHVFDDGREVALHRDLGATEASLEACAAGAGHAWRALVETLWPHREQLVRAALGRIPPVRATAALLAGLRTRAVELAPIAVASAADLGRGLFGHDGAAAWLAGSAAHSDLPIDAAGSGALGLGLNFLGHTVGWPYPRGGAQRLTDSLVARLRAAGGELRCDAAVERIATRGGTVSAVQLRGGEVVDADAVVCTASPGPLMQMLPPGALPGRVERRLRSWRYGPGTLKLDYALSAPVPWRSEGARRAAVVHVGGPLDEVAKSLLVVGQQSLHDSTRAPEGQHTLYVYSRERDVATVEAQLERYAPGFGDTVLARRVRTPADIERENPSMRGGDLASGSFALDQLLVFRPAPELCRYRTPLSGLYVAGAWVHPGAGVHGMPGWGAAQALHSDLSAPRRMLHRVARRPR